MRRRTYGSRETEAVSGKYMLVAGRKSGTGDYVVHGSSDFGATFREVYSTSTQVVGVHLNSDGTALVFMLNNSIVKLANEFNTVETTAPQGLALGSSTYADQIVARASKNGQVIVIASYKSFSDFYVHISTNGGVSFSRKVIQYNSQCYDITMSDDGTRIVFVGNKYVHYSTNGGTTIDIIPVPKQELSSIITGAGVTPDGSRIVSGTHYSTNGGASFIAHAGFTRYQTYIRTSQDGQKILAYSVRSSSPYPVSASNDYGATSTPNSTNLSRAELSLSGDRVLFALADKRVGVATNLSFTDAVYPGLPAFLSTPFLAIN